MGVHEEKGVSSTYNSKQEDLTRRIDSQALLSNWKDWKWQLKHGIKTLDIVEKLAAVTFSLEEKQNFKKIIKKFPMLITPYYFSLINWDDYHNDPIYRQSFPMIQELNIEKYDMQDPLSEDEDSPVPAVTHRYPDRVLFHISNICAMYCRHCTRKRKVGEVDSIPDRKTILGGIDYISNNPAIRDVLLSGGDPLMLSDDYLDWILEKIKNIDHVKMIRIGTRIPVVLPYRITDRLIKILQKYHPLWINIHFNHPYEITVSTKEALKKLADGGFPLGNQSVLLAGVNDCPRIMKALVHKLLENRVRPYYLYQCDLAEGLSHFRTPVAKGIEIMESLIGHTTGLSVPTYVIDAPGGGGKIPIMPQYLISWSTNKAILRNYEGVITSYNEPASYKALFCDRNCSKCSLPLKLNEASESNAVGVAKLLSYNSDTVSLVPRHTERYKRRGYVSGGAKEPDKIEFINDSIVQHGKFNNRIYLQRFSTNKVPDILTKVHQCANENNYSKIFAKVPISFKQKFIEYGYIEEAFVPKLFDAKIDVSFMSKFLNSERANIANPKKINAVLNAALQKEKEQEKYTLPNGFNFKIADKNRVADIASVYKKAFANYSFPIFQTEYILKTMKQNIEYFCILKDKDIIALSSLEKGTFQEVKMSNFATLPEYRGNQFSLFLLEQMERKIKQNNFKISYTIIRAQSYGMNIILAKSGYKYGGTLVNHANVLGKFESMNVWYKTL